MVKIIAKNKEKRFIGVAWPYVNGDLHIGHLAGYLLPADIFARYSRATGHDALMVSGSDCFGTPITIEADKREVSPKVIIKEYHTKDVYLFKNILNLSYDLYTKTATRNHIKVVQDIFIGLLKNGFIFIDTTKQYYSSKDNKFLPDRYVEGVCKNCDFLGARSDQCDHCGKVLEQGDLENPVSKLTGSPVELKDTQHYFIDWPKLQKNVETYVKKAGPSWKKWVYSETLGWLKQGIKPRAISRDLDWGVPLPIDRMPKNLIIKGAEHKRLYVWFDAVIGYLSASILWSKKTGGDWKKFWKDKSAKHYYFMGKDNLIFHTIFWPGQIMGYDDTLKLPDFLSINMFLNLNGKQFSKSRGVTIPIKDIVEKFGNDPVRFYLTLIMPETKDSSFNWNDFYEKNNEILVNNLGNFVHRVLSISFPLKKGLLENIEIRSEIQEMVVKSFKSSKTQLDKCEFKNFLDTILTLSSYGNQYLNEIRLWELKNGDQNIFKQNLTQLYVLILTLGFLMYPLMPDSASNVFKMLNIDGENKWPETAGEIDTINKLLGKIHFNRKPKVLFRKIDIPISTKSE